MKSRNFSKNTIELIWVKACLNLRSESSVNYLSYAWWVIEPLLHMVVYYIVFSFLLKRGGDHYVAFLLTGLIPWLWFSKSLNHATSSIMQGKQLMNQLFIPKIIFPATFILQDFIKQVIVFILLIIFLVIYGMPVSFNWCYSLVIFVVQLLFITGCSLLCALVVPFIRDMAFVIPTTLQFIMFCSGIFFSYRDIPEHIRFYFFLNPMACLLASYRDVFIYGVHPSFFSLAYVSCFSLGLIVLAIFLYKKFEYILPRVVLE